VVYDHFLANDLTVFPAGALNLFCAEVYGMMDAHVSFFPPGFSTMYPYMKNQNWLLNYASIWGTAKGFAGLVRRARYLSDFETATRLFETHYQRLQECYRHFWETAEPFAHKEFILLKNSK
jgi:acyl carrier protein phosphodiesterase